MDKQQTKSKNREKNHNMSIHSKKTKDHSAKNPVNRAVIRKHRLATRHLTGLEFRAICYVTTMLLAAITIIFGNGDPSVWQFLAAAIGIALGQIYSKIN